MTDGRIISAVSQKIVKDHVQPVRTLKLSYTHDT